MNVRYPSVVQQSRNFGLFPRASPLSLVAKLEISLSGTLWQVMVLVDLQEAGKTDSAEDPKSRAG